MSYSDSPLPGKPGPTSHHGQSGRAVTDQTSIHIDCNETSQLNLLLVTDKDFVRFTVLASVESANGRHSTSSSDEELVQIAVGVVTVGWVQHHRHKIQPSHT